MKPKKKELELIAARIDAAAEKAKAAERLGNWSQKKHFENEARRWGRKYSAALTPELL